MKAVVNVFLLAFKALYFYCRAHLYHFFSNMWKRRKFKGRTLIPKGHRIYSLNPKTRTLEIVTVKPTKRTTTKTLVEGVGEAYKISDLKIKKGCVIITALNDLNAQKRALKYLKFSGHESEQQTITITREV